MVSASTDFRTAVYANSPRERVLFRFADGTLFEREDINSAQGIKFTEGFNLDEELKIGACPSSTLEATFMNYDGYLTGYDFGEAEVLLGVRTATATESAVSANAWLALRYGESTQIVFTGHDEVPYLRVEGNATNLQPAFAVKAIAAEGTTIYCFGANGEIWSGIWSDGNTWTELESSTWTELESSTWDDIQGIFALNELSAASDFMTDKFTKWSDDGRGVAYNSETEYEFYVNGTVEKYEYVKLGTFNIETPAKRKTNLITVTAYDRMILFDIEADSFLTGLTYPITLGNIYDGLCTFVGVTPTSTTFVNSTREYDEAPFSAENITAREILSYIAEAAGSYARMTRDGEVEIAWFGTESVTITPTQTFSADIAEYQVAVIDKLQIKNTENDIGVIIGTGTNAYVILDNPYLYGDNDTEIRTYGTPIYNQISAFAEYNPMKVTALCDWSIQAGDIITVTIGTTDYDIPIFCQTITWKGGARVTYESTGSATRPVVDAVNRRIFNQNRTIHELVVTADSLDSRISDAEGDISDITQYAESITLSVTNGTTSSTIKLLAGETEISSQSISMSGLVTFTNLSTAGQTTINGGNITTGSISADRISTGTLSSVSISNLHISMDGSYITFDTSGGIKMNVSGTIVTVLRCYNSANSIMIYAGNVNISADDNINVIGTSLNIGTNAVINQGTLSQVGNIGFFGTTPIAKRNCAQLSGTITLDMAKSKINEIIEDLGAYGLLSY